MNKIFFSIAAKLIGSGSCEICDYLASRNSIRKKYLWDPVLQAPTRFPLCPFFKTSTNGKRLIRTVLKKVWSESGTIYSGFRHNLKYLKPDAELQTGFHLSQLGLVVVAPGQALRHITCAKTNFFTTFILTIYLQYWKPMKYSYTTEKEDRIQRPLKMYW